MAIKVRELLAWVLKQDLDALIATDDGGLSLIVVGRPEVYIEVGGVPVGDIDQDEEVVDEP